MTIKVDYIADWTARLKSRLYEQFKSAVTWNQWCVLLGKQAQDFEDAAQSLFGIVSIDDSNGVQLDVIGRVVGQNRVGLSDDNYRPVLRARILANKSTGTVEDIYAMLVAFMGGTASLTYEFGGNKAFVINVLTPMTAAQAPLAVGLLLDAKEAGARALLQWQQGVDGDMFAFAGTNTGLGFGLGQLAGILGG